MRKGATPGRGTTAHETLARHGRLFDPHEPAQGMSGLSVQSGTDRRHSIRPMRSQTRRSGSDSGRCSGVSRLRSLRSPRSGLDAPCTPPSEALIGAAGIPTVCSRPHDTPGRRASRNSLVASHHSPSESARRPHHRSQDQSERSGTTRGAGEYLSLKGLAGYPGLSVRTLRGYLTHTAHPLPHYRVGGKLLVKRSEFDDWMRGFRTTAPPRLDSIVADVLRSL